MFKTFNGFIRLKPFKKGLVFKITIKIKLKYFFISNFTTLKTLLHISDYKLKYFEKTF